jgi:hypothetical protein
MTYCFAQSEFKRFFQFISLFAMGKVSTRPAFILSKRSQRRRTQKLISKLLPSKIDLDSPEISTFTIEEQVQNTENEAEVVVEDKEQLSESELDFETKSVISSETSSVNSDYSLFNKYSTELDLESELSSWAKEFIIQRTPLSALLKILKLHPCFDTLPSDPRTLLNTPRFTTVQNCGLGQCVHFGFESGIQRILKRQTPNQLSTIQLQVNIDGLPLFKSSDKLFWPILGSASGSNEVFVIGIYCGPEKPNDVNLYLTKFVEDLNILINEGIYYESNHIEDVSE